MSLSDLIKFLESRENSNSDSKTPTRPARNARSFIHAGPDDTRPTRTLAPLADYGFCAQDEKIPELLDCYDSSSSECLETIDTQEPSKSNTYSTQKSITIEKCEWLEIALDQTDEESNVMLERYQSFITKGLTVDQAREAAQLLLYRDRDYDDRRSCAECAMYNFGCNRGLEPVGGGGVEVLHRCKGFADDNF